MHTRSLGLTLFSSLAILVAACSSGGGTTTSSAPSAAAFAPSFEDWLNDLSSSVPTSVTTPILRALPDGAADPGSL